jgi:hypothetical protein
MYWTLGQWFPKIIDHVLTILTRAPKIKRRGDNIPKVPNMFPKSFPKITVAFHYFFSNYY